jgi:carbonic anhydrase/acetyltransferase-like protein (isoleucine patch superfamily)
MNGFDECGSGVKSGVNEGTMGAMTLAVRTYCGIAPSIADGVYIDSHACVIGSVILHNDVGIWPMVVIRGDVNQVVIGARSNVQDGAVLHVTRKTAANPDGHPLVIGQDVTVGHKAMLHGCQIGDRVLVGMGAIILDGAIVESNVIIGAGSLVPPGKHLEQGYLYMGNPARQARALRPDELIFLSQSASNYVRLKDEYLAESRCESPGTDAGVNI